jgi:HSP20 family protein
VPQLEAYRDPTSGGRWQPAVDVFETGDAVVVRAELAGVRGESLRVTVHGGRLLIRGERVPPRSTGPERHHRLEIAFGPFERRIDIPVDFEQAEVAASLEDGLLTVVLPRRRPTRHRIPIRDTE